MIQKDVLEGRVPIRYAKKLLRMLESYGCETAQVINDLQLPQNIMKLSDDGHYVSVTQYSILCQQAMNSVYQEDLGLQTDKGVTSGAFRMMCYAIIHCNNLGDALKRACEFFRIFYTESFHLNLRVIEDQAYLGYERCDIPVYGIEQIRDTSGLGVWHRFSSWLISEALELDEVHFLREKPDFNKQTRYNEMFNATVSYSHSSSLLVFDRKYLNYPILQTEKTLKEFLSSAPHYLLVMPSMSLGLGNLVAKVRSLIGHDFSQGFPSFEEISTSLNMSGPTLRRHLKKEGVTFQQIKDNSRREAAVAYLSRPELSINTVAALMGFTEPSAFHRSFKKWTGKPPGVYRKEALFDPKAQPFNDDY
ncbi:MAG: AraC family transcriptional regulator ligand-binding domain-containing protein [Pseudomonadota bacterium]